MRVRERERSTDGKRRIRRVEVRMLSVFELEEIVGCSGDRTRKSNRERGDRDRERVDTCLVGNSL